MPSQALRLWLTARARALDELEHAHRMATRRRTTQAINQSYALMLAAHFQAYCRSLQAEAAEFLVVSSVAGSSMIRDIVREQFSEGLGLDRGNARPEVIKADFERLGVSPFWDAVEALDQRNGVRRARLVELNEWRNVIAHHAFGPGALRGRTVLKVEEVRRWRRACDALARSFDSVTRDHLAGLVGAPPWL